MKIYIPHLFYTVEIKPFNRNKLNDNPGYKTASAGCRRIDRHKSVIYIKTPISRNKVGELVHELTHVLQNICQDRDMIIENERENLPYLMGYLVEKVLEI